MPLVSFNRLSGWQKLLSLSPYSLLPHMSIPLYGPQVASANHGEKGSPVILPPPYALVGQWISCGHPIRPILCPMWPVYLCHLSVWAVWTGKPSASCLQQQADLSHCQRVCVCGSERRV